MKISSVDLSVGWTRHSPPLLRAVNLAVGAGVHCIIGPNGSGKSTLIRTLAGIIEPLGGKVTVDGNIGYCAHRPAIYSQLTTEENLYQWSRFLDPQGVTPVEEIIPRFELSSFRSTSVSRLSQGQRQRLGLARAFLGQPSILFLDEPTSGLDPISKKKNQRIIKEAGQDSCVLVSSHDLLEVSDIADTIIRITSSGTVVQVQGTDDRDILEGYYSGDENAY